MYKVEQKVVSKKIYDGKILNLRVDDVLLPSGINAKREVVEHKNAVAVLPIDACGRILFVSQYRYAVSAEMIEIPAGLCEEGESPKETAVRELQEECGYKPESIEKVCEFYCSPGFSTELVTLYIAKDLKVSRLPQDADECIEVLKFTLEEAMEKITKGEISDAKTIAAIYWYASQSKNDG